MNIDFDDEAADQNSYYSQYQPLENAWLYIAIDIRNMSMAKIGLTTRESPESRIAQGKTYNPFLTLFTSYELSKCTYGSSQKELNDIESYIHRRCIFGNAIKHLYTERDSEWFLISPENAEHQIDWILAKRGFAVDNKSLYTHNTEYEKFNYIAVERMKKIKKINRPNPYSFSEMAENCGISYNLYAPYYEYLLEFHNRDADGRIYL
ncbi:GIY-YIG nuclease family protein (plasmid) [Pseudoalteromonas shioyasakiensis]|nr:GIY-YIG nuclease family protein [Pseudoalteromonas shioyasakiensis]